MNPSHNEFLQEYQKCYFNTNEENPLSIDYKRRCLILKQVYSNESHTNAATIQLLDEDLKDYHDLLDKSSGINDFAQSTLALISDRKSDSSSWKSTLASKGPKLSKLLTDFSQNCVNRKDGGCALFKPAETNLDKNTNDDNSINKEGPNFVFGKKQTKYAAYDEDSSQKPVLRVQNANKAPGYQTSIFYSEPQNQRSTQNEERRTGVYFSRVGGRFKKWNDDDDNERVQNEDMFVTAKEKMKEENQTKKYGSYTRENFQNQGTRKTLGGKRPIANKFVTPFKSSREENDKNSDKSDDSQGQEDVDERLKNIDPKMVELIRNEIMDHGSKICWDDIAGLKFAKDTIQEIVVWPMLRPDIFTGLRRPPKGILLFGPPGTGKTLIGKCIASQSNSTFFSISASSLTSKWIGDGEKMVRALFAVARVHQPSVVFIDEIDSLLSQRSDTEHECSRRIKTEFLVQLDGAATGEEDRILVIGATNRPQELDEAARRRLVKRIYIPLPDFSARIQLVNNLMKKERNNLSESDVNMIANMSEGYSGADVKNVCQEACLGPIRSIGANMMVNISAEQVRPVDVDDFKKALKRVKSSVSPNDLIQYISWNNTYGFDAIRE